MNTESVWTFYSMDICKIFSYIEFYWILSNPILKLFSKLLPPQEVRAVRWNAEFFADRFSNWKKRLSLLPRKIYEQVA